MCVSTKLTLNSRLCCGVYSKVHRARTSPDSCSVTSPLSWPPFFCTIPLVLGFSSSVWSPRYCSSARNSANSSVLLRHCRIAFMKHVLPWFFKPATPGILSLARNPPQSLSSDPTDPLPSFLKAVNPPSSLSPSGACSSDWKWESVERVFRTLLMKLPTERTEPRRKSFLLKPGFFSLPEALLDMFERLGHPLSCLRESNYNR